MLTAKSRTGRRSLLTTSSHRKLCTECGFEWSRLLDRASVKHVLIVGGKRV
jgi:hypothetical protein